MSSYLNPATELTVLLGRAGLASKTFDLGRSHYLVEVEQRGLRTATVGVEPSSYEVTFAVVGLPHELIFNLHSADSAATTIVDYFAMHELEETS